MHFFRYSSIRKSLLCTRKLPFVRSTLSKIQNYQGGCNYLICAKEETSMTKERFDYLDATKGIGILIIMWGHFQSGSPIKDWTNSFKLALFYLISGMLIHYKEDLKDSFQSFLTKKFRSLIIPYFWFSGFSIAVDIIYCFTAGNNTKLQFINDVLVAVSFRGLYTLWFLPSLFIGEMLLYLFSKFYVKIQYVLFLILPAISVLLFHTTMKTIANPNIYLPLITVSRGIVALFFCTAGYYFYTFFIYEKRNHILIFVGFLATLFSGGLSILNHNIDLNNMSLGSMPLLFFVCGVVGAAGVICLFKPLTKYYNLKLLIWCGKNSLILMITHLPLRITDLINIIMSPFAFNQSDAIGALIKTLILLLPEYLLVRILSSNKMKFLLGK